MIIDRKISESFEVKPFVKWAGGKRQLLPILIKNLPDEMRKGKIDTYAEPFVGGGILFFKLRREFKFKKIILVDINKNLINAYVAVRDNVQKLIEILKQYEEEYYSATDKRRFYYEMREKFNTIDEYDVEKAAIFLFLNKTCFNGLFRVNSAGKFNVPFGRYKNPKICDERNLLNASAALSGVELIAGDFTIIERKVSKTSFVYLDPPYRPISETSSFTSYSTISFGDSEQIRLANFVKKLDMAGVKFMLSNSFSEDGFFQDLYANFKIDVVKVRRYISASASGRNEVKEIIVKNY